MTRMTSSRENLMSADLFGSLATEKSYINEVLLSRLLPEIAKVGPEGYIHGYICVRPPCGDRPSKVKSTDMVTRRDGEVVHKKSGWSIGRVDKHESGKSFVAHHADGKQTKHDTKIGAEIAITRRYNRGVVAEEHNDIASAPKTPVKEPKPVAATKPKRVPKAKPAPEPTAKPAAEKPVKPAAAPTAASGGRTGDAVWKTDEGTASLPEADKNAIGRIWYGPSFYDTQMIMRNGNQIGRYTTQIPDSRLPQFMSDARAFTKAINSSKPFESDAQLYRGIDSPAKVFGNPGSMVGKTFTDKGFTSATSNTAVGASYSAGFSGKQVGQHALITIHARAGSHALKVDPDVWRRAKTKKGQTPVNVLQEYTFAPGQPFKVISDAIDANGVRQIHVEAAP
jgi:hypothetical protein